MSSEQGRDEATPATGSQTEEQSGGSGYGIQKELIAELDRLLRRLRALAPDYEPPRFSRQRLQSMIEDGLEKCPAELRVDLRDRLRETIDEQWFEPDTWKGIWYMANYTLKYNAELIQRRSTGDYDTDEWGVDWEFLDVVRPFFTFLYKVYWRVKTTGIENIPIQGRTLLVANHSGQLPWDGTMIATAVMTDHSAQRLVRTLYSDWVPGVPFLSSWMVRIGQTLATEDNGIRLLQQDELVAVFPEGHKGSGKLYRDRYRLAPFGHGDFVKMALETRAPIIPVSVVGAEETYISLAKSSAGAKIINAPYLPISPTFPWLGLLGLVPLPTKWYIDFGEPMALEQYEPDAAQNLVLVSQISDQVRNTVQEMVHGRMARRSSVFF